MLNRIKAISVIAFLCAAFSYAHGIEQQDSLQVYSAEEYITFRVGNIVVDKNYNGNDQRLSRIINHLHTVFADSTLTITSVEFTGMASPEGPMDNNFRLSSQRMEALSRYVRSRVAIPDSLVSYSDMRVSWEYLDSLVVNSDMEYRNEVSHIINNTPIYICKNDVIVDGRKKQLMEVNYGRTWHEMDKRFFQSMRNASAIVITYKRVIPKEVVKEEVLPPAEPEAPDTTVVEVPLIELQPAVKIQPEPFYMALKTNVLYDVLAIPNIGIEFYLGKNWSAAANWHYAWWKTDRKHWYWRTYGGDVALRKWFGSKANEKPLTGHHIGVYGQMVIYDFETGNRGYLGDRWSFGGGIEYGYSLPIKKRFNIDFTLGVGYLGGEYKEYLPMDDCYVWQATKDRKWFGPTKAEISFVWLLGRGNTNKRKGGNQ